VIISAGFSEIGGDGKEREETLGKIAKEKDLNILGPNCLGFIAPGISLNASFAGGLPSLGNIAFISQSGALAVALMDVARREKISFSYVISVGNKMQMDEASLLEYLRKDENTKVIGMYLEGIKDGKKFLEVASKVSREKPIVVIKAGKGEKSQKAISSHTGALAGSDEIASVAFEKAGVIQAETLEEFFSLLSLISFTSPPLNENSIVITNAGGPGVLTTDSFEKKNIKMVEISNKVKEKLRKYLPEESSLENPIDVLGDAKDDRYKKVFDIVSKNLDLGSVITLLTPQDQTPVNKIASKIIQFRKKTDINISAVFIGGDRVKKAIDKLRENAIPNFNFPDQAVLALSKYYKWSQYGRTSSTDLRKEDNEERKEKVFSIIKKAKEDNRTALYFSESKEIMDLYGVKTADCFNIDPGSENLGNLSFPVVVKVDSDKVLHKTDKQALVLNIKNEEDLRANVARMQNDFPGVRLIVQPMQERGTELIVGIKKDDIFGPVVVYGLGGIYTEILRMVNFLMPPIDYSQIKEELTRSKIGFLFRETRGQKLANLDEMASFLLGISQLAYEIPEIKEFDINPLIIYSNEKSAIAVDVKVLL
jgi:acetyltransferase